MVRRDHGDVIFADTPFIRCGQKVSYCLKKRSAIDERIYVEDGDLQLRCWFLDKTITICYLIHGGSHCTHTIEFKVRLHTAVCKS